LFLRRDVTGTDASNSREEAKADDENAAWEDIEDDSAYENNTMGL
jgi:hypothetical protein